MRFKCFLFFLLTGLLSLAQEQQMQDFIEQIATTDQRNISDLIELYHEYKKHPLNINSTKQEDFDEFPFLTTYQTAQILAYQKRLNGFVEVGEIRVLHLFTEEELAFILPLLTVRINPNDRAFSSFKMEQIVRYSQVIEEQPAYADKLVGSKPVIYFRNKQRWDEHLRIGLTIQKDAGEYLYNSDYTNGFDFVSVSLHYQPKKRFLKEVLFGDYSLNFGQGLIMWTGFSMGKGVTSTRSDKNSLAILPYHSSDEVHFMRGISSRMTYQNFTLIPFVSYKKVDAEIQEDSTIRSIRINGLHRTDNEISQKDAIDELLIGGHLNYKKGNTQLGCQLVSTNYSVPFYYQSSYQKQYSTGKHNVLSSIDHSFVGKNWQLYGELAINQSGKTALLEGINLYATPNITFNSTIRKYASGYKSFYANSFGERRDANNEIGFYNGLNFNLGHGFALKTYLDLYSFPSFSYNENQAITGQDFFSELQKKLSAKSQIYIRFKTEKRTATTLEKKAELITRVRLHYKTTVGILTLQSRIEASQYNKNQHGFLIFQDIKTQLRRVNFTTRLAYFDTPTFQTAVYAYQPNVLYAFRSMAYYNQGFQFILMSKIHITHQIKLWIKAQRLTYINKKTVSSSYYETTTPHLTELTFQLQFLL